MATRKFLGWSPLLRAHLEVESGFAAIFYGEMSG